MSVPLEAWFTWSWYGYLLSELPRRWFGEESKAERIVCRIRGHPRGEVFYNLRGYEPDHRCRDCGEDLG